MNLSGILITVLLASALGLWLADDLLPQVIARTSGAERDFFVQARGWLRGVSTLGGVYCVILGVAVLVSPLA
uniref:Uncharacterized protein n=1 Tax=Caulobacter phage BL57 TaxID=3348355 RepID=A0AB74UGH0_9VIRU